MLQAIYTTLKRLFDRRFTVKSDYNKRTSIKFVMDICQVNF